MSTVLSLNEDPKAASVEWDSIICFANDWCADPLSKKHLMLQFAQKRRILWINSVNNRRPRLASKDMRRTWQKIAGFRRGLAQVHERIWVLSPLYVPFHSNSALRTLNRKLLGMQIRQAVTRLGMKSPITYTFAPTSADVAGTLGEKAIVYHCVDEFSAFSDAGAEVAARESELIAKSDIVLCSAAGLFDKKKKQNSRTHLIPHGVDYEFFRTAINPSTPVASELRSIVKPILGFTGLLADWVDLPVLADLARRRPEWSIVLIGRSDTDLRVIEGLKNVHLLGHRPYQRLPEYLRGFDVALLPFINNELTVNANPLKLREYMAAGLPVVASPLPEVVRYAGVVSLATTAEEYEKAISELLDRGDVGPSRVRSGAVASESWEAKAEQIENLLAEMDVAGAKT